ncbi:hypothetical protein Ancab_000688 [Ancistrocladus abbreviatus]
MELVCSSEMIPLAQADLELEDLDLSEEYYQTRHYQPNETSYYCPRQPNRDKYHSQTCTSVVVCIYKGGQTCKANLITIDPTKQRVVRKTLY